jgi:hypothetical protein
MQFDINSENYYARREGSQLINQINQTIKSLSHAVNQSGSQFGLVTCDSAVLMRQLLRHIRTADC